MTNSDSSQAATALLTEHLQYTPLSLIDDIINSVNNFVYQGVGSLEAGLFSTPPERLGFVAHQNENGEVDYPEAKQEIEEGLHKLETLLNSTVDKNFDKFEIYILRNILSVPTDLVHWMRLSHYENISWPPAQSGATLESVTALQKKLAASRTLSRALNQECNQNEKILQKLRAISGIESAKPNLSFLSGSAAAQNFNIMSSSQLLTTNVTFTMSQLPVLKEQLADLRAQLARLKEMDLVANSAKDERRQERREYIEQRTQAHIAKNGTTSDESIGFAIGTHPDQDGIEAMEKIAAIFHPS